MLRYQSLAIFLLLVLLTFSNAYAAAGTADQLKYYNFNLYPAPSQANNMILRDLKGHEVSLAGLRGKVVILNFWKVDCHPCSMEKPILERIYRKYGPRGLDIVAVNLVDSSDRILNYVQRGGYTFTFAFDPGKRFAIRPLALKSGVPATFVVNSNSEAIYEVPGVPTTYLINRQGAVVGNAVGLTNWEERPLANLLESLLGPVPAMTAQNSTSYSSAAQQGPVQAPQSASPSRGIPPAPGLSPNAQLPPSAQSGPQKGAALPFQGSVAPQGPVANAPAVSQGSHSPSSVRTPSVPQAYQPPKSALRTQKKPQPARSARSRQRTSRTYNASAIGSRPTRPPTTGAARSRRTLTVTTPAAAVPPRPFNSTVPPTAQGPGQTPYLPPASPYSPSNPPATGARQIVVPDQNGTVTARIPSNAAFPGFDHFGTAGRTANLPPAQPLSPGNPIGGFILDSFGRTAPQVRQTGLPRSSGQPASSLFGQIGQDVQGLASGIKDTVSRIVPVQ
ncbi:MAG: redoxin domain-containing protein [Desulfomonilaceae bacterium]